MTTRNCWRPRTRFSARKNAPVRTDNSRDGKCRPSEWHGTRSDGAHVSRSDCCWARIWGDQRIRQWLRRCVATTFPADGETVAAPCVACCHGAVCLPFAMERLESRGTTGLGRVFAGCVAATGDGALPNCSPGRGLSPALSAVVFARPPAGVLASRRRTGQRHSARFAQRDGRGGICVGNRATALMLGAACLFLRIRAGGASRQRRLFLTAGAVVAAATLIRPVFAAMLLPFLWAAVQPWKPRTVIARAVLLVAPMLSATAASLAYNANTFGSPFRNGYHFWVPVPYDYFAMVFSLAHVPANFAILLSGPLPFLLGACVLFCVLARRGTKAHRSSTGASAATLRDFFVFVLCTSVPILIFHLVYFFPSERFFIPLYVSCAVIAAVLLTRALGQYRRVVGILPLVVLVLGLGWRVAESDPVPNRRLAAERIRTHTPADAIVISAIDPLYLNYFAARGSARRIVPLDRTIDHAGVIAPKRVPRLEPPPTANDPYSGILNGGGTFAVRVVAVEQLPALVEAARHGRGVFLDTSCMRNADRPSLELLDQYFRSVPRGQGLYQLEPL